MKREKICLTKQKGIKKNVNVVIDDTDKKIGPVCADKDDVI